MTNSIRNRLKSFITSSLFLPFLFSFIIWIFTYRGFIFGRLAFVEDAVSYLNQTKFLTDAMLEGNLLLWSSEAFGMPNDFFLLRLGAFNPLYLLITLFRFFKIPFFTLYVWTLAGYYFLGCLGFYFLARRLTDHRPAAFTGFLLIYFSALGSRIFDSYIVLVFVPLMWFAYFMVDFFQGPSRKSFLGIVFTMMLLLSTYIPFYFIFMLIVFSLLAGLVFPKYFFCSLKRFFAFIGGNRILFVSGVLAVMIALIPGLLFFQSSRQGEFVMPLRHNLLDTNSAALEVHPEVTSDWALIEDIAFSAYFTDLRDMKFAIFYVPLMTWILLSFGLFTRISKRLLFYLLLAGFFVALGIPRELPLYRFSHTHFFFFKYFRNLHFFLWWLILPVMVLFITEQTKQVFDAMQKKRRLLMITGVLLVHLIWLAVLLRQPDHLISTVISVVISWIFFSWVCFFQPKGKNIVLFGLGLLVIVVLQPVEVFTHLSDNSESKEAPYYFERHHKKSPYQNDALDPDGNNSFYIVMNSVRTLQMNLSPMIFYRYSLPEFVVYDHAEALTSTVDWEAISRSFNEGDNRVFLKDWDGQFILTGRQEKWLPVRGPEDRVDVVEDKPNMIKLKTSFDSAKVLVINETFSPFWKAYIDGKSTPVYQANIAFKAVCLPPGNHIVTMRFEKYMWVKKGIWFTFTGMFAALLFFLIHEKRPRQEQDENIVFQKNF